LSCNCFYWQQIHHDNRSCHNVDLTPPPPPTLSTPSPLFSLHTAPPSNVTKTCPLTLPLVTKYPTECMVGALPLHRSAHALVYTTASSPGSSFKRQGESTIRIMLYSTIITSLARAVHAPARDRTREGGTDHRLCVISLSPRGGGCTGQLI